MSKINKYLELQLKTNLKKDAEDCIKIKNKLKELDGAVWSSKWSILIDTKFKGFPYDERTYKPSKLGYIFLNGIKDNPVPSLDRITVGKMYPTDSTMCLDDKEYTIESNAWNIISLLKENKIDLLLNYIYENFNKDLIKNGVETNKEQPKDNRCSWCIEHNEPECGCE